MPLPKRILFDLDSYRDLEEFQDSDQPPTLESKTFSSLLGACRQLSYLSIYALETFQNITALANDVNERVKTVTKKTERVMAKVGEIDKHVRNADLQPDLSIATHKKFFRTKDMASVPPLFVKTTLPAGLEMQYNHCRPPPQLWRIESLCGIECFTKYSFPGYFFQEWLRAEVLRQELEKRDKKKSKAMKKQQRMERKKLREERAIALMNINRPKSLLRPMAAPALEEETTTGGAMDTDNYSAEVKGREEELEDISQPAVVPPPATTPSSGGSGGALKRKGIGAVFSFLTSKDKEKDKEKDGVKGDKIKEKQKDSAKERERDGERKDSDVADKSKDKQKTSKDSRPTSPAVSTANETAVFAEQPTSVSAGAVPSAQNAATSESATAATPSKQKRPSISMEALSLQLLTGTNRSQAEKDADLASPSTQLAAPERRRSSVNSQMPAAPHKPPLPRPTEPPKLPHYKDVLALENTKLVYSEEKEDAMLALPVHRKKAPVVVSHVLQRGAENRPQLLVNKVGNTGAESILNSSALNHIAPLSAGPTAPPPAAPKTLTSNQAASTSSSVSHVNEEPLVDDVESIQLPEEAQSLTRRFSNKRVSIAQSYSTDKMTAPATEPEVEEAVDEDAAAEKLMEDMVEALRQDILQSYDLQTSYEGRMSTASGTAASANDAPPEDYDEELEGAYDEEEEENVGMDTYEDRSLISQVTSGRSEVSAGSVKPPPPPPPRRTSAGRQSIYSQGSVGHVVKPPPPPPKPTRPEPSAAMGSLLSSIKQGAAALKSTAAVAIPPKITVKQNEAVAAILANRSKIAGDSESESDSDDDYTDDGYG